MMEELMPELVGMVLSHVDCINFVACWFVCTTWMCTTTTTSPPPRPQRLAEQEDWSKHFAAKGLLALLQWAQANSCPCRSSRQPWSTFSNTLEATGYREETVNLAFNKYCQPNSINEAQFHQALALIHLDPTRRQVQPFPFSPLQQFN
jgi:hypothetical protein